MGSFSEVPCVLLGEKGHVSPRCFVYTASGARGGGVRRGYLPRVKGLVSQEEVPDEDAEEDADEDVDVVVHGYWKEKRVSMEVSLSAPLSLCLSVCLSVCVFSTSFSSDKVKMRGTGYLPSNMMK